MMTDALSVFSAKIGAHPEWVQAAGGNISEKKDSVMRIKASGTWLAHAGDRDIFVPVNWQQLKKDIVADIEKPSSDYLTSAHTLRPSIETGLHAILPDTYVLHVHAISTIVHAIQVNAKEQLEEKLAGLDWCFVPYVKPGVALAKAIMAVHRLDQKIIVLGNHGLIITGESLESVFTLLNRVETRLATQHEARGQACLTESVPGYQLAPDARIHQLAFGVNVARCLQGVFYPDHVVFLGAQATVVHDLAQARELHTKPPYIIVKNQGVLIKEDLSLSAYAMLDCLARVLCATPESATLATLSDTELAALLQWDAEKYRQERSV